jgi:hypothetical protein
MAAKRIPQLDAISGVSTANDDNLVIYDTSAGATKRILRSQLALGMAGDFGGATGTFTTADSKTVTVVGGIITEITP